MDSKKKKKGRRQSTQEVHYGTTGERVYLEIKVTICICILLYQKEGWETTPYTRLPEIKPVHNSKQIPLTPDTGTNFASQRRKYLLKI